MGMESVEILMDIEDAFGLRIPKDLSPGSLATVGDIVELVTGWIERTAEAGGSEAWAMAMLRDFLVPVSSPVARDADA
jgi:hypothetical protein